MIKKLNFKDSAESKLFCVGCTHLNHNPQWENPIWKMRGFSSAQEMTDGIIKSINDTCNPMDTLLVLGDFCLNTSEGQFHELINRINPRLFFLRGNHNSPWESMYYAYCLEKFGHEVVNHEWLGKITYLGDYVHLIWNKQTFIANHYPFYIWDKMSHNSISLCSHSHGGCLLTRPENTTMKQIDTGWDVWRKPIGFKEIMDCANKKGVFKGDDHH